MDRRVLVPLDGSPFAEHALPCAVLAAARRQATLELVLVHSSYSVATLDPGIHQTIERWQADQRAREAEYLRTTAARTAAERGLPAHPVLLTGNVPDALSAYAARSCPDLIVMTTHGRGGLERAWLGSVADALVRQVSAPVLLIRPSSHEPRPRHAGPLFRHLVVALDGTPLAEHALLTARTLAEADTRLSLLRVVVPPRRPPSGYPLHGAFVARQLAADRAREAEVYLLAAAASLGDQFPLVEAHVLTDFQPAAAIVHWARGHTADGIALSTHGRAPALRLLLGSITDEVIRKGSVPVLVG